jgi:hypothetical protein
VGVLGGGWLGEELAGAVQAGLRAVRSSTAGRRPLNGRGGLRTRACDCRGGREVPDLGRRARQGARTEERRPDHRSIACAYGSSGHEAFLACGASGGVLRPWEGARRPREGASAGPDAEAAAARGAARRRV